MQVPYSNCSKIQEKNNIQSISKGFARHNKNTLQIQRCRNNRRAFNARSYTYAGKHTAKDKRVEFYGVLKRKKCTNDIR